jgi:hypothetical protein
VTDVEDVALADAWLASLGVTLWADWDVTDPNRRRKAAEWFVEQYDQLVAFAQQAFGF